MMLISVVLFLPFEVPLHLFIPHLHNISMLFPFHFPMLTSYFSRLSLSSCPPFGGLRARVQVTVSVARTVLAGQLWLYLPPWEEPKTDEKGNATHTSSHACRAPPLFSGPAFTGSAFAVQTSTGSAGSPHSDGGDKASANCASGSSTAPQQLHSPLDVWRVGVSVGDSGGVLVVEW